MGCSLVFVPLTTLGEDVQHPHDQGLSSWRTALHQLQQLRGTHAYCSHLMGQSHMCACNMALQTTWVKILLIFTLYEPGMNYIMSHCGNLHQLQYILCLSSSYQAPCIWIYIATSLCNRGCGKMLEVIID